MPISHLAQAEKEEIASPLFSTGVGLVIKGFEALEAESKKMKSKVTGHSTRKRGSFFDNWLFKPAEKFFDDQDIDDDDE